MPETRTLAKRRARSLASRLVDWYEVHRRDLPWRGIRDPYGIWLSEIMLQQTRVETVIPRYERFLRRFPDLESLAAASTSEVLAEWAGLGYYRRARSLHAAAQRIVEEGGRFPRSYAGLLLLPGLGRYAAGAIASIAFDEQVSAVDGNVERVLSRLLALAEDPKRGEGRAVVEAAAHALVESAKPSELNQALMELGALVCTPRNPRCSSCPWKQSCRARAESDPERFPLRAPRPQSVPVSCYAAVHREGEALLFRRRAEGSHNAGLWELPTTEWHGGAPEPARAGSDLHRLGEELGARWEVGSALTQVRHGITKHRIQLVAHEVAGSVHEREGLRWATCAEADTLGVTAATRKLLRRLPTLL